MLDLLLGKVGVEIWPAEQNAAEGMMVGPDGARLLTRGAETPWRSPPGALGTHHPRRPAPGRGRRRRRSSAAISSCCGRSPIDLTGQTLQSSAVLSIPVPAGFDPSRPVVLARVVEVGGVQRLKLVGFGELAGSMLVSTPAAAPPTARPSPRAGITVSGTYVFLQAKAPIGFVAGRVDGIGGAPFAGARVSADGATLVDTTGGDGRYLLALPLAPATVTALDPVKLDRGEGSAQPQSAWQLVPLDLAIAATPPRLLGLEPADGAVGVEPNAVIRLTFSEPVDRASVSDQSVVLKDAAGDASPASSPSAPTAPWSASTPAPP